MTIREWGTLLRSRKLSCVELLQQTLTEMKKLESLHIMITVTAEQALAEAVVRDQELAKGIDRGPLHGIPTAYKDIFYTQGVRTTGGSLLYKDFVPAHGATVVARLINAGTVSVGKTNLHELAYGATSKNPHYGAVRNPLNPEHIAGGSSGGSAALVASHCVPFSLGTDTGGSIRIPASYCGVFGLKPTYGRVSRYGVLPLAFSLDHVGPLASCAEDIGFAMNAISGQDPKDASSVHRPSLEFSPSSVPDLKGLRVGVPRNFYFSRVQDEVAAAVLNKVSELKRDGVAVLDIDMPDMEEANTAARIIQFGEATSLYAHCQNPDLFGEDVWALIQQGRMIRAHEYVNAQRIRSAFRRHFDQLWNQIDVIIAPTTPITAPRIDDTTVLLGGEPEDVRMASTRLCRAINFLGEPSLSMPCGQDRTGLPVGMQLIGPPFSEAKLLQVARSLES
jgi:aspartyl-tRNA(Asn)/glutamyl-tRNA(Gln) amidotransferase subunit A